MLNTKIMDIHSDRPTGTNDLCLRIEIRKIMNTPCKPKFYYIKWGLELKNIFEFIEKL